MLKRATIFIVFTLSFQLIVSAQYNKQIENVRSQYTRAASDSDKVIALGNLADIFYIYRFDKQGDSALTEQLRTAELSNNSNLILATYFGKAITDINTWTNKESFDKTIAFIKKGLDYANSKYLYDYMALAYSRMATTLRKKGDVDKSFESITKALTILPQVKSDSIKTIIYIELGDTYYAKGEAVPAFTNYNTAYDIAFNIKNVALQSEVYHRFAGLYYFLEDYDDSKKQLLASVQLNKTNKNTEGLVKDYIDLGRYNSDTVYIKKALELSLESGFHNHTLRSKIVMFSYYMTRLGNADITFQYLKKETDVKNNYLNVSEGKYNWMIGQVYMYSGNPDSALHYFNLAEPDLLKNFDHKTIQPFYDEMANCYRLKKDQQNAIKFYLQSLALSKEMNDISVTAVTLDTLSALYESVGDYTAALSYSKEAKQYNSLLQIKKDDKNVALLGVEAERKKHEAVLAEQQEKFRQKRNIQLMAITIVITIVFGLMLLLGMFSVSKLTIKMMGYFAFISLFEFIVLLIDTFLLNFTHGEPLKLWIIKIFLIAMLVPVQHFLEHRLIKFLESRKLLEVRTKFSIKNLSLKNWLPRKKASVNKEDIEEDTAVL